MSGFYQALPVTLDFEGGYTEDTGGPTMRGVTQATYDRWRRDHGQDPRTVKLISDDEVAAIYHKRYWLAAKCDALPWPLSMLHFDCAVNVGPKRAIELLQQAVGVKDDGIFGPKTAEAVRTADDTALFNEMLWKRAGFYVQLGTSPKYRPYLAGWLRRVLALRDRAAGAL